MKIFLVERTDNIGYDEFSGFACYAKDEEEARNMKPSEWEDGWGDWIPAPETLKIECVGISDTVTEAKVIGRF